MAIKKIRLCKEFYSKSAIEKTIVDFKDVCKCELYSKKDYYEIIIESKEKNAEKEFANYVLALMK